MAKKPPKTRKAKPAKAPYSEQDVIIIIVLTAGKSKKTALLKNVKKLNLVDNLGYQPDGLDDLQIELDYYVKSVDPKKEFTDDDLGDCDTIGDVIDKTEEILGL